MNRNLTIHQSRIRCNNRASVVSAANREENKTVNIDPAIVKNERFVRPGEYASYYDSAPTGVYCHGQSGSCLCNIAQPDWI